MEIHQAIESRRTIHRFNPRKVTEEIVTRAVWAANQAPCHRLTFPWRFTKIGTKKREDLARLSLLLKFGSVSIDDKTKEQASSKILNPSHLLIVSQIQSSNPIQRVEDYAACACAIQNLALSLSGEGVGCKWSTGELTTHNQVYEIAEINPKDEEIIGFIWIGYGEKPPKVKRPSTSFIYRER